MSIYSAEDEYRIRTQALVREWTKSGLLDPSQGVVIEAELRVDVRRTNLFLRAGLALFNEGDNAGALAEFDATRSDRATRT